MARPRDRPRPAAAPAPGAGSPVRYGRFGGARPLAPQPEAGRLRIRAEQVARPEAWKSGRGSCGRDGRPRARRSRGGPSPAPGSAASYNGSRRDASSFPSATPGRRRRPGDALTPALARTRASRGEQDRRRVRRSQRRSRALELLRRPADHDQPPSTARDPPRPRRIPAMPVRRAVERHARAGRDQAGCGTIAASCASTQARWPAAQSSAGAATRASAWSARPRRCADRRAAASAAPAARRLERQRFSTPPPSKRSAQSDGRRDDVRDRPLLFRHRPAAHRHAGAMHRLAVAADQIMPVRQRLAFRAQPIGAGRGQPVDLLDIARHRSRTQSGTKTPAQCDNWCSGARPVEQRQATLVAMERRRYRHPRACAGSICRSRRTAPPIRSRSSDASGFSQKRFSGLIAPTAPSSVAIASGP